ncbi:MAG TPA: flagellar basal-body MS-ring/collar protein FliF [Anaerolineae bacterium]|nr:flagellar basal-body MS-ring/collar protein FliF [Anaerolineae bacterium]
MLERLILRLREVWAKMTLNQKVVTGGVLAALLLSSLYISTLSQRMIRYTVLIAQLDAASTNEIITDLEQQNIPYRITQGGTAIEVPAELADRLKIQFAAQGLLERGIVGYEILDTTNFGMSDFLQKVNYKRALEGELGRTLRTLDAVEFARVHLVIPEPSLYTETAEPPTASVVLALKRGKSLTPQSVEAIANLVASAAVEGLNPQNVKIIDTQGTLLSKPVMDEIAMQSRTVIDLRFSCEKMLADKVKQMIDGAFGSGIALVTVSADINFDRIERNTEYYDQDRSAIMGEERIEITNPTDEGGGEEHVTTNYDTGRIVENLISSPGSSVNRLTVSVMMDGKDSTWVDDEGEVQIEKVPWSDVQLASIRSISEAAVGFNTERGDRLEIVNIPFSARERGVPAEEVTMRATIMEGVKAVTTGVAILAALGIFYLIVRSIIKTLEPSKMKLAIDEEFVKFRPRLEEEEGEVVSERAELIRKIVAKAVKDPDISAKTIRSIYHRED